MNTETSYLEIPHITTIERVEQAQKLWQLFLPILPSARSAPVNSVA